MSQKKQLKKQLKKQVSIKETEKIEIPKYVLKGNQNIPEDLKKVLDYFRDCGNQNYQVCLVGEKESVAKDLKEKGYQGEYPFIHFDPKELDGVYGFLPVSVKNSIRRINKLISNPENVFNTTILGIHTLGLVRISEIPALNEKGYGTTSWNSIKVYEGGPCGCLGEDRTVTGTRVCTQSECFHAWGKGIKDDANLILKAETN